MGETEREIIIRVYILSEVGAGQNWSSEAPADVRLPDTNASLPAAAAAGETVLPVAAADTLRDALPEIPARRRQ